MWIRMTQDRKGTNDGCVVKQFYTGEKYQVSHSLAAYFLSKGYAEEILLNE